MDSSFCHMTITYNREQKMRSFKTSRLDICGCKNVFIHMSVDATCTHGVDCRSALHALRSALLSIRVLSSPCREQLRAFWSSSWKIRTQFSRFLASKSEREFPREAAQSENEAKNALLCFQLATQLLGLRRAGSCT